MRPLRQYSRLPQSATRAGVALVITIVMLSVITFLTVAFLALMGREKGAVKTSIDQTTARLAAEAALTRATSELLASIMATTNIASFDLLVSTNYINYLGFDPGAQTTLNPETNVNFEYLTGGGALSTVQFLQNLTNLLYSPRVPVYITNRLANTLDFRYYLDLNRNRRFDRTGVWPVTNSVGQVVFQTGTNAGLFLSNHVIGDPQWLGNLDRPDKRHAADNKFLSRSAFVAVPEGKTLDANFIHNAAGTRSLLVSDEGFLRNQGVAPWEMNLAGFLADLNTNFWNPIGNAYDYRLPTTGLGNRGAAFEDAQAFLTYRYANNYNTLALGFTNFLGNFVDEYSDGVRLTIPAGLPADNDITIAWAGSDNTNRYFSVQDFFDPTKTSPAFVNRLNTAGNSDSSYDRYTYYRLLSQLGTASTPEDPDKLNLNYKNVNGLAATNFVAWTNSLEFFTNAANRLLVKYSQEWLASDYSVYTNLFRMDRTFGVTNIPVIISNQWVYSSAIHRALQLAANIWETKNGAAESPTVFRPRFRAETFGTNANVYIYGFVAETDYTGLANRVGNKLPLDLIATNNPALAIGDGDTLVYGAPPVIGARKGLPNFNEFASELLVSVTRKLQVRKQGLAITETNQVFVMEVQMPIGNEFWNSYATNFPKAVSIRVTNFTSMTLTNDLGSPKFVFATNFLTGRSISIGATTWPAYRAFDRRDPKSFVTNRANFPFLPQRLYAPDVAHNDRFYLTNDVVWDESQQLIMPRWGIAISNRVHAMILDQNDLILDYVVLGNMTYVTNLTDIIADSAGLTDAAFGDNGATPRAFKLLWATNQLAGSPPGGLLSGRIGVINQINISVGSPDAPRQGKWNSYGKFSPDAPAQAVAKFNNFMYTLVTNGMAEVPYSPSFQFRVPLSWQANDPLVHYMAGDLYDTEASGIVAMIDPAQVTPVGQLPGLGAKNSRYYPWPVDATTATQDAFAPDLKDPLVRASDEWQFPTNVLPSIGWLGRVHRGTPWQTVYLKANDLGWTNPAAGMEGWVGNLTDVSPAIRWRKQTGNRNVLEGYYYRPVTDRVLFDVFTASINDNSTRGRLSINQTNLAAWSAVFSGVVALTNTSEFAPIFNPWVIEPAGVYDPLDATTWSPLVRLVNGINALRANPYYFPAGAFTKLGDILAVPELSDQSVFLNRSTMSATNRSLTDPVYEWLPQQTIALLHLDESPRFSIYAYGQSLQPAPDSIVTSGGDFFGLCTNYAITSEVAIRAVVRVEGSPNPAHTNTFIPVKKRYPPRVVVESYNYLAPD